MYLSAKMAIRFYKALDFRGCKAGIWRMRLKRSQGNLNLPHVSILCCIVQQNIRFHAHLTPCKFRQVISLCPGTVFVI